MLDELGDSDAGPRRLDEDADAGLEPGAGPRAPTGGLRREAEAAAHKCRHYAAAYASGWGPGGWG